MTPQELIDALTATFAAQRDRETALSSAAAQAREQAAVVTAQAADLRASLDAAHALTESRGTALAAAQALIRETSDARDLAEAERDAARTQAAAVPGLQAQVVSLTDALAAAAAQVTDLTARVEALTPPAGALIPVASFRERIVMAYLRLPAAAPETQAKWKQIIADFLPADRGPVNLVSPATAFLIAEAAKDGLLTGGEAAAALKVE